MLIYFSLFLKFLHTDRVVVLFLVLNKFNGSIAGDTKQQKANEDVKFDSDTNKVAVCECNDEAE